MERNFHAEHVNISGDVEIVKILIQNGAKINVKDVDGDTPLEIAEVLGHTEVARILEKGGKFKSKDNYGETPSDFKTSKG